MYVQMNAHLSSLIYFVTHMKCTPMRILMSTHTFIRKLLPKRGEGLLSKAKCFVFLYMQLVESNSMTSIVLKRKILIEDNH